MSRQKLVVGISVITGILAIVGSWFLGFRADTSCSEDVGSVSKQFGGLATPCALVTSVFVFAAALIIVLTFIASFAAHYDRRWIAIAALASIAAVPLAVWSAYGQGQFS